MSFAEIRHNLLYYFNCLWSLDKQSRSVLAIKNKFKAFSLSAVQTNDNGLKV